jgi:uncharacterized membrane protein
MYKQTLIEKVLLTLFVGNKKKRNNEIKGGIFTQSNNPRIYYLVITTSLIIIIPSSYLVQRLLGFSRSSGKTKRKQIMKKQKPRKGTAMRRRELHAKVFISKIFLFYY